MKNGLASLLVWCVNLYDYYFQFTLNPYDKTLEEDVPLKSQTIIKTFIELLEEKTKLNSIKFLFIPSPFEGDI